jgi:hypothetical protein
MQRREKRLCIFVENNQKQERKFLQNNEKMVDKKRGSCYINKARSMRVCAMKREIARIQRGNFRGVCPVSGCMAGCTIGRLKPYPLCSRISHGQEIDRLKQPVCFSDVV